MKLIKPITLIFGLVVVGCNQTDNKTTSVIETEASTSVDDKEQIQNLIRQVLNWANSKNSINFLPVITDSKDSVYIGFDLDKHKQNLDKLQRTNFFATEFIENYNQIILTLNKGLRNGKYGECLVGDSPPFGNNTNPWCNCQDVPYDNPNPWKLVEIKTINLNNKKGEFIWKWENLEINNGDDWKNFVYKFRVIKEKKQWKISYLEGFDFNEFTRKNY